MAERAPNPESARGCLRSQGGSAAAQSRLLIALCRNRGIHARLVSGLEIVVRDPRAQVVDVVEPDVAGEEAEDPRKFEVGASLERGVVEAPCFACLPVGVLELMLHVEEPDPDRARE